MNGRAILASMALLAACSPRATEPERNAAGPEPRPIALPQPGWRLEDGILRLADADGALAMTIACPGGPPRLVVTAPSFKASGSEDRFALGLGDEPVTLVADPTRQGASGVVAEGPIPPDLKTLFSQAPQVSALYGIQRIGPGPSPSPEQVASFVRACAGP